MNDDEARKQIRQMCAFILQEATEKATEIKIRTEHDFNLDKQTLVHKGRLRLEEEFAKKVKDLEVQKRIAHSQAIGEQRTRKMKARHELLDDLLDTTKRRLAAIASDEGKYAALLQQLIVQGLVKLQEKKVEVRCRAVDLELVRRVSEAAVEEYKAFMQAQLGQSVECAIKVNDKEKKFLPPPPGEGVVGATCSGGVVLLAQKGRILCDNTLDSRLGLAFEQQLPTVRGMLFPSAGAAAHTVSDAH